MRSLTTALMFGWPVPMPSGGGRRSSLTGGCASWMTKPSLGSQRRSRRHGARARAGHALGARGDPDLPASPAEPGEPTVITATRYKTKEAGAVARVQYAFPGRILHEPLLLLLVVGVPVAVVAFLVCRRYGPIRVRK